jgi:lipopolysaccharide/colanic/teichoic acid biosynthesis glycosyltransferase
LSLGIQSGPDFDSRNKYKRIFTLLFPNEFLILYSHYIFIFVTVRVTSYPGPLIAQHKRALAPTKTRQPHRCAKPKNQASAKKKNQSYKIETKAIKQIKQIKHYGTSPSRPKQTSHAWAAASHHAAENSTHYNPRPQMTDS